MLKHIIYFSLSVVLFFAGCLMYGTLINLRESGIEEVLASKGKKTVENPVIFVYRKAYKLVLYDDTLRIKEYRAFFGRNAERKTADGDLGTPMGDYKICAIEREHVYHRFIKLNYPSDKDIDEAYRMNRISGLEYENLRYSYFYKKEPDFSPVLGGNVAIHGIGRLNWIWKNLPFAFNWTNGSIALGNEELDEVMRFVKIGTVVKIR